MNHISIGARVKDPSGNTGTVERVRAANGYLHVLVLWDSRSRTWARGSTLTIVGGHQ